MRRQIIEEHRFAGQLQDLIINSKRADDFVDGAKNILSLNPSQGKQTRPGGLIWFIPAEEGVPGLEDIAIYYAFDETRVWLLSIQKRPEED